MLLITVGEMIDFPFSNAFAMNRSKKGKKGQYLAIYIMTFSLASVFGHNDGIQLINKIRYGMTWNIMLGLGLLSICLLIYTEAQIKKRVYMNLNQITIASLDVTKSTAFYKTLGLNLIANDSPRYVRLECPNGDSTFSISHVDELPKGNKIILYFEVENLSKTVNNLKKKGVVFNTKITKQPWLWTDIHLNDPDGHEIIIFNAGDNRKNPPWRVN